MRSITLFLVLFFSACAVKMNNGPLYSSYYRYDQSVSVDNLHKLQSDFFSSNLIKNLNVDESEITEQLLFKKYMFKQKSHFEKINEKVGCLSINGFDNENMPISFNIKYIAENEHWLIEEIGVLFVNSIADFTDSAKCPSEYQN
jgi:coproporphyrinogen III oxidase-like Fe-S oxidoreductase